MPPETNHPKHFPWPGKIIPWSAALRSQPARESRTLDDLLRGEPVQVLYPMKGWLYVQAQTGKKGYVSRELIRSTPVAKPVNTILPSVPAAQKSKADWQYISLVNAFGQDLARLIAQRKAWVPVHGFAANKQIIAKVYDYYGALYRRNPKRFQWSGLARMAGGPFYKGFCDMENARALAQTMIDSKNQWEKEHYIQETIRKILLGPPGVIAEEGADAAIQALADHLQEGLKHLMDMGQAIFYDLAWQHEAYQAGGLAEIKRLADTKQLGNPYYKAWQKIDSGDIEKVWEGNRDLLYFEQHDIIADGYAQLQDMMFVPTAMSALAQAPHPWGQSFYEYYSMDYTPPTVGPTFPPVFFREVTKFSHRWAWLENNIWPTWKKRTEAERARLINLSLTDLGNRKFK
ncbi:MAG TPA: SH3 domain-containing protein [Myxococcaceae bacterium]|jgi:hypothetical protein